MLKAVIITAIIVPIINLIFHFIVSIYYNSDKYNKFILKNKIKKADYKASLNLIYKSFLQCSQRNCLAIGNISCPISPIKYSYFSPNTSKSNVSPICIAKWLFS